MNILSFAHMPLFSLCTIVANKWRKLPQIAQSISDLLEYNRDLQKSHQNMCIKGKIKMIAINFMEGFSHHENLPQRIMV
jgi:predicted ribonuclease YlaK